MSINERIFIIIKELGVSQKEFAFNTGIKESSLSEIKREKYEPSAQTIIKISEVYNINTNWLLTGKGSKFIDLKHDLSIDEVLDLVKHISKLKDFDKKVIDIIIHSNFTDDEKNKIYNFVKSLTTSAD